MTWLIGTLFVGLVCGAIARFIFPGEQKMGWIATIALGIGGSFLANFLGSTFGLYKNGDTAGYIASVVGALVLLFAWSRLSQPKASNESTKSE